jgi:hypothetical protein
LIELIDYLLKAFTATSAGQLPYLLLHSFNRDRVNADTGIIPAAGKAKAQIGAPPRVTDGALFRVHFHGGLMSEVKEDKDREHRVHMEIVVDAYPLSQLQVIHGDDQGRHAVEDWHYWVKRGYQF